ncbi:MAG: hypothetical protein RR307_02650, partial [Clostridia bacterium]
MKKNSIILISILLLVCLVFTAGCALDLSTVEYIQISNAPKTTYVQKETIDLTQFTITVKLNGNTTLQTFNYAPGLFEIKGFSTVNIGAFKAIITYQGVSAVFDYEVVSATATKFAGGTGTNADPYLISNAKHWNDIDAELTATTTTTSVNNETSAAAGTTTASSDDTNYNILTTTITTAEKITTIIT